MTMFYVFKPYLNGFQDIWGNMNNALMFAGLSLSFSTLQDTTKTQNEISKKVWKNPLYSKIFIICILISTFIFFGLGTFGYFISEEGVIKEVAFGTLMLGIGNISLLKAALEMAENHQKK
jgi:hypothetical protein